MKLSELQPGAVATGNDKLVAALSVRPFWSLDISPVRNPFSLFSFASSQDRGRFTFYMYKTSYYTSPVISRSFGDVELSEVTNWILETLNQIKTGLL